MTELPEKLSELLRIAVDDAEELEATPGFSLDMGVWRVPANEVLQTPCLVCMAGAVIQCRVLVPGQNPALRHWRDLTHVFPDWVAARMEAINMMRDGDVRDAHEIMYLPEMNPRQSAAAAAAEKFIKAKYSNSHKRAAWKVYRLAADILEDGGL